MYDILQERLPPQFAPQLELVRLAEDLRRPVTLPRPGVGFRWRQGEGRGLGSGLILAVGLGLGLKAGVREQLFRPGEEFWTRAGRLQVALVV